MNQHKIKAIKHTQINNTQNKEKYHHNLKPEENNNIQKKREQLEINEKRKTPFTINTQSNNKRERTEKEKRESAMEKHKKDKTNERTKK